MIGRGEGLPYMFLLNIKEGTSNEKRSMTSSRSNGVPAPCFSPKLMLNLEASGCGACMLTK